MSYLHELDEEAINNYKRLDATDGKGTALKNSVYHLRQSYLLAEHEIFGPGDTSAVHDCVTYLVANLNELESAINDIDTKIDNLVARIKTDILDVEDATVSSIREG